MEWKKLLVVCGTVLAGALLFAWRGDAQTPMTGPGYVCSGFQIRGYNAYAKTSQDRESNVSWDIRAIELPPGWQPIGVVQRGTEPLIYACHPQPPRAWGNNRITIRP